MYGASLEWAAEVVSCALSDMAEPVETEEQLVRLATAVTGDPQMGAILGEMFDILGPDGAIIVEEYLAPYLDREYIEGFQWDSGCIAHIEVRQKAYEIK